MSHFRLKGTSGSVVNRAYPFADSLVLGSAQDCDVQIDEPGVAPRHAEIRRLADHSLVLSSLDSRFETLLNGQPIRQQPVHSGDEIRIGSCRWMLQAPGLRPARLLSGEAVQAVQARWPRVLAWTLVTALAVAVAVLKFRPEWLG